MSTPSIRERGAALIVSLIMLLIITILAVTAFRLGEGNFEIVGNIQQHDQDLAAAQDAIDQTISSVQFTVTPANAIPNPCTTGANTVCVAASGGTGNDIDVKVTPSCDSIQPIPVTALDFTNSNDAGCLVGESQSFGVVGGASGNSMCSNSVWNVQAVATDTVTGATAAVNEGVGVRVASTATCP